MGFLRFFDITKMNKMSEKNMELFLRLKTDITLGVVFPAVRKGEIHFYYKGGCLYKFNGVSFVRDKDYEKYSQGTNGLDEYEKAKKENENKFANADGTPKERQLLDILYKNTFNLNLKSEVVVLDIEVRLNGEIGGNKKCDMVLLNTQQPLPQIMFVEGKVFSDKRIKRQKGNNPEVIEQVNLYTKAIHEQEIAIVFEYINHINIINELFGTTFESPFPSSLYNFNIFGYDLFVQNHLVPNAKLLVYDTPTNPNENGKNSIKTINKELGENNVMWVTQGNNPTLEEIWEALCK